MTARVNCAYFTVCAWLLAWDSLHGACRQRNEFTLLSVPMPCNVSKITTLISATQSAKQHAGKINMILKRPEWLGISDISKVRKH